MQMQDTPPQAPANPGGGYKAPDWKSLTPPPVVDTVERIVAAGAKLMYAPDTRDELKDAVKADVPVDQKLADNVLGLLLMLDQKAKSGLPVEALFPAGVALMDEAAQVLQAAGQPVTQDDFDGAMMRLYTLMAKKLGASDDDAMKAIGDAIPDDGAPEAPMEGQPAPGGMPGGGAPGADPEMEAMRQGMAQ